MSRRWIQNLLLLSLVLIVSTAAWAAAPKVTAYGELAAPETLTAEPISTVAVLHDESTATSVGPTGSEEVAGVCQAATGLPTTVVQDMAAGLSCPSYFWTASSCNACWAAFPQCINDGELSSYACYDCFETCLGRVGCFIP